MRLVFNPITGNLDYITDSTDWIARNGTTTTTAAIPFAEGLSFPVSKYLYIGRYVADASKRAFIYQSAINNTLGIYGKTYEAGDVGAYGGSVWVQGGSASGAVAAGETVIQGGESVSGTAGNVRIIGGQTYDSTGGDVFLSGGQSGEGYPGMVAVAPLGATIPAAIRNNYALYVQGAIYSDNLSASTMLKSDANKGLVSATAGTDFTAPGAPLTIGSYGIFSTLYKGDVSYAVHIRPDLDLTDNDIEILSWGNDDIYNYSGKPYKMAWDHTAGKVAFTDGSGNNLAIAGLSSSDSPYFTGLNLSDSLTANFLAWNDQVFLDWGAQEFKIRNYLETNKQVTLDCNTYLYIMAQSTLCGYFTSSGFNMIDDKGMVLGSPGSTKINSIWGTTNGQRTTANVAPYRQTGILAVADVDYSAPNYVAGRAWIICDGSDRSYNFAHDVMANPTLFIQSANQSQTEWIGFNHNQTNGVISTGTGKVVIASPTGLEIGTGAAGVDYTLSFNGETNDGLVTWKEDEDYLEFNDDIMLANAEAIYFANSTSIKIYSSAGDTLDFSATNINASGTLKATSYKSNDGSTGATGTFTGGLGETITVKNGLVTDIGAAP